MINHTNDHDKLLAATAEVLRERRNELDLSQEELSSRSGLHRTYISDIELGKRNISLLNLARLAGALGLSASELLQKAQERAVVLLANANTASAPSTAASMSSLPPASSVGPFFSE
jgi:transcriptional regulator with XRE-family HTH domain